MSSAQQQHNCFHMFHTMETLGLTGLAAASVSPRGERNRAELSRAELSCSFSASTLALDM